jgi:lipopolysaccharide transport system permease protein
LSIGAGGSRGVTPRVGPSAHLFLLRELVRRDFQGRYAGSLLGFLWSFVQPLWQLLLFSFVFSLVMRVPPVGERTERFWVFLFCGLLPWTAVHEGILRGTTAVTDNSHLVRKLRFPAEILVVSVVLAALLHQAIAGAVFVVALVATGELSAGTLPWLLVAVPLQAALTCGLALLLSSLHVFFRDTAQLLGMVLSAWFYVTPIVYPLALAPEALQRWLALNPLAGLVALYRTALLGGTAVAPGQALAPLAVAAAALLLAGWLAFRRLKPAFPDEV